jgi:hypothetical protein
MHERYTSPRRYIVDAALTAPLVIMSRIRRTMDPQVLLMEAFVLYLSLLAAARFINAEFLAGSQGLLRLAIPAAVALIALVLEDAYADPAKRSPLKPMRGAALGVGCAFPSQAVLLAGSPQLAVPRWIMIAGAGISVVLLAALRMLFPPIADRPQGAGVPAYWQKRTVEPVRMSWGSAGAAVVVLAVGAIRPQYLLLVCVLVGAYLFCRRG